MVLSTEIYQLILKNKKGQLAILIDPEKYTLSHLSKLGETIENTSIDLILVGSSLSHYNYDEVLTKIRSKTQKPIVIFPGNSLQLSSRADALLNLSLISGRNPEYLIGEHVKSALYIQQSKLEVIPTAYILIDGGVRTSAEYMSHTQCIPAQKNDIILATALAGQYLGMKAVYLEAGSGAKQSISPNTIKILKQQLDIPIICGGGVRSKAEVEEKWDAGAQMVVIGTAFEENPEFLNVFKK
ncbi:MAG: geranylgeranylglyceryl/heptaprenylglyceryl phosphate synthase [Bacteroidales bacterium]|nr:geranylgeranylglyceryl/heptaprenylglyceryl phosphate synthase [Bacteroidales bacterium]